MKKQHEKSHFCIRHAWMHSARRRQCSICGKTWTCWKRKRGRKRSRPDKKLLKKIFVERQRLNQVSAVRRQKISRSGASRRLKRAMTVIKDVAIQPRLTGRKYILLIDALWYRFGKERYTLYLQALKKTNGCTAYFLPPILLHGKESLTGWEETIASIPPKLKSRIKAMVSDGWRGVEGLAKDHNWILQRCHFHFIAQLQVNRGKWKQLPDQSVREKIYQVARKLLTTKTKVIFYKEQLTKCINRSDCPKRLKSIIRDYLHHLKYFRSYLNYHELHLPNTTNAMESKNKQVRQVCRPLRTPESLLKWATSFLKFNPEIVCNGEKTPHN